MEALRRVTDLTNVCPQTIDLDLAHRFGFAWSTSYSRTAQNGSAITMDTTMGDGLSMISAVHTLTGSATTYSTQIVGNPPFSKGALETAETSFVNESYDNLGIKVQYSPDTIFTTDDPSTCNQVRELINATADITTSNSGTFNVYSTGYKHIKSGRVATTATGAPDSSKAKYRFLLDSKASTLFLTMLNEPYLKVPMDGNNGETFLSENWNYMTSADYGICVVSADWVR